MSSTTNAASAAFAQAGPTPEFPYELIEIIGRGSMGIVFRARDVQLERDVAIKLMRRSFVESLGPRDAKEARGRFIQEAKAAAKLRHPGVTVVHRVGMMGEDPYIAMEWLDGWTVEQLLVARGAVSVHDAARFALKVLDVLRVAHDAGVVHRDIKPANLIITRGRRVKVTDFGIARVQGSLLAQTQAGLIVGTPQYGAPEQLAGAPIDGRSDLYALGTVLYELVTGRPPFVSDSAFELVRKVRTESAPPPSAFVEVPPGFDAVMATVLAKSPNARFASAAQMAAALRPFVAKAPRVEIAEQARVTAVTARAVPALRVGAETVPQLVVAAVRTWPAIELGRRSVGQLFEQLLERPLHAPAFCGALISDQRCILVCDGIIYAAFDARTGVSNDALLETLPSEIDATIHSVPEGTTPRIVALLASLLLPPNPTLTGLDATFADLPALAERLGETQLDGAMRFVRDDQIGFALFNRGARVLDVFTQGWNDDGRTWQAWIADSGATASVEPLRFDFPSITFRQQLAGIALEVVRPPSVTESGRIRTDAVEEARALVLRPRDEEQARLRRGDATLKGLVATDPILRIVRWVLTDLPLQFDQYGRTKRWRALVDPLNRVDEVRLHHSVAGHSFDAVLYGPDQRVHHVIDRVAVGDRAAIERFLVRADRIAAVHPELGGAILIAPSLDEGALAAYVAALQKASRVTLRTRLHSSLSHREGFVATTRGGFHALLIEDGESLRPLVPE